MKVLDLRCGRNHRFEGWFASEEDYVSQGSCKLIACPICDDKTISRLPSAPRLNVSKLRTGAEPQHRTTLHRGSESAGPSSHTETTGDSSARTPAEPDALIAVAQAREQAQWLRVVRHVLDNTEDVGDRFPEEARRIHYGESTERSIRGRASKEDAEALRDEGIEVSSLPVPEPLKGTLQ
jgi:hypothetical protein